MHFMRVLSDRKENKTSLRLTFPKAQAIGSNFTGKFQGNLIVRLRRLKLEIHDTKDNFEFQA